MFKRYMVLSDVWGEVDCRMFDSFDAAMNHKLAAECGAGAKCSQIYEWNKEFGAYEFLCE